MSDVMLFGVLEMPTELWRDDPIDIAQRHSRYMQAAERIREQAEEIQRLSDELTKWRKGLNSISYDTKDAEIQRLTEAQRWIPVSERLPEDGDNVVATMNFEWYGCCKYQGFFPWVKPNWMANSDRQTSDPVTHWMPLPSPPKDTGA